MTLDTIAETIGTVEDAQIEDDGDRFADDSTSADLAERNIEEYDGGWSADH